ncbi:MAG: hypothetical protein IT327_17475 [Anaerolineae bacterium]|nr:hypothetical protein [Anaerolineae bacterium]
MAAKTLPEAFSELDPHVPVKPQEVKRLFVSRPHSPVYDMQAHLQIAALTNKHQKILFVGHRGAGKSSELSYLSNLLANEYISIFTHLFDVYQNPAVTHVELVFAIYLSLLAEATKQDMVQKGVVTDAWEKLLERIYTPMRQYLFGEEKIRADSESTFTLKLSVLVAELETKIGTEAFTRNQVKERFEGRIAEILDNIKQLARLIEQKLQKRILFVIEDLDKFDINNTRKLFLDHTRTLTSLYPSVIYTFPVALRYDNSFPVIKQGFDNYYLLPNVSLEHRDGTPEPEGETILQDILVRRVTPQLFSNDAVKALINLSGGHLKSFMQLSQQAVLNAVVEKVDQVQLNHVEEARRRARDDYMVILKKEQIALLRQLKDDPNKDLDDTTPEKLELLFNDSLREYRNTRGYWANVNPLVLELLSRE